MSRILLSLVALLIFGFSSQAQQDPQYTQWYMDQISFNPAVAGTSDLTCVTGFYRQQWNGLDNSPTSMLLTGHTKVDQIHGGVTASFYNDELGQKKNNMLRVGYSYHLDPLASGARVSFGAAVSMFSKTIGNTWVAIDDYQLDPAIPNQSVSANNVDVDLGAYVYKPNEYYAGISATHVGQMELGQLSIQPVRHYYFMGGYNYQLDGEYLVLRSNFLAKTDLNATAIDVNLNVLYENMVWAGVSFRPGDAIAPVVGFQWETEKKDQTSYSKQVIRVGYSYDTTLSELSNYSSGSHEITLSYCFKFMELPIIQPYHNPRFL